MTLRHQAKQQPDAPALRFEGRVTTFGELDAAADRVAFALLARGMTKSERLIYLGKNCDQFFPLLYGAMRAGVVLTPLNWRLSPDEACTIVQDSHARLAVVGPDAPRDVVAALERANPALQIYLIDPSAVAPFDGSNVRHTNRSSLPAIRANDIALQLYTSGTTGLPKGVMLTHRGFVEPLETRRTDRVEWEMLGPGDSVIVDLPVYHLGGTSWPMIALQCGAGLLISREFSATFILQAYGSGHRIPAMLMVPATIHLLLAAAEHSPEKFDSLRYMRYGGSPIAEDLLRRCVERFDCRFVQTYGSTETGGFVTALGPEAHVLPPTPLMRSAGRAVTGVEIVIADADGRHLAAGTPGEIIVRSPSNMAGYWGRAEASQDAWFPDGWLRTGDAGRLDDEGFLFILDRMRDMIITGGENVYPAEVENILASHPAVGEVAVVGLLDDRWGEVVCACIVLRADENASEIELQHFCADHIARYKCPKVVRFMAELPRNASGKVLRRLLRETRGGRTSLSD